MCSSDLQTEIYSYIDCCRICSQKHTQKRKHDTDEDEIENTRDDLDDNTDEERCIMKNSSWILTKEEHVL